MPKCKRCKKNLTKFDKEICPFCGEKNPLNGNEGQTLDITESIKTIDSNDDILLNYKQKSKLLNALLCMFFGIFGIDEIYLGFKNRFLIRIIVNAVIYVILVLLFYFTSSSQEKFFIFVLPLLILFTFWLIIGLIYLLLKNKKDSNGAFLK